MEGFNVTISAEARSSFYNIITRDNSMYVAACIIIGLGLPLTLVTICPLYFMVRKDHVAPIFVINLLMSNLLQLCSMIIITTDPAINIIFLLAVLLGDIGLGASLCFMVCIALERYLVIARPQSHCCRHPIKTSVVNCVGVWILVLILNITTLHAVTISFIIFLLPFPLFLFFLGGTLKALPASCLPADEKRRVVGTLFLLLLTYLLLFVPTVIVFLIEEHTNIFDVSSFNLKNATYIILHLNPLADVFLYFFMKKGAIDKPLASVCCCPMDSNNLSRGEEEAAL